jgi:hypothetical protein
MAQESETLAKSVEGRYANYFKVGHNAYEVVLEFGQFYEGNAQPNMHTRIVTSPAYAMTLMEVLRDSLERYERAFGSANSEKRHE